MSNFNKGDRVRLVTVDHGVFVEVGTEGVVCDGSFDYFGEEVADIMWDNTTLGVGPGIQNTLVSCIEKV